MPKVGVWVEDTVWEVFKLKEEQKEEENNKKTTTNKPTKIAGGTMKVQKLSTMVWHNACNSCLSFSPSKLFFYCTSSSIVSMAMSS